MATLIIPVRLGVPDQLLQVELEGVVYGLHLRWNHRGDRWALNLLNSAGLPLCMGRRVCLGTFLLPRPRRQEWPPGELLVVDEDGEEPALTNFGDTAKLIYVEAEGAEA